MRLTVSHHNEEKKSSSGRLFAWGASCWAFRLSLLGMIVFSNLNLCVYANDLTSIELEELLATEVVPANKVTQQISDAPSAVSIITAQDIQDYGYRNLAEILDGMRGLFSYKSDGFTLLGGRGLSGSGSLSGRLMLLIDGQNVGENFFNRVLIGDDSLIDVGVIDRVEYVPGAGSIRYGNSAFLGTINVITKKGADALGAKFAVGFGTGWDDAQRLSYGATLKNGADVLVSASRLGGRQFDRAFPATTSTGAPGGGPPGGGPPGGGVTSTMLKSTEQTSNQRLFAKVSLENTTLTLAHGESTSNLDTLRTLSNNMIDMRNDSTYLSLENDQTLSQKVKSSSHIYYGQYLFKISDTTKTTTGGGTSNLTALESQARWWGIDQEFVYMPNNQHKILAGFSFRDDYGADFTGSDGNGFSTPNKSYSLYMHDLYQILPHVELTYGGRLDHFLQETYFIPRLAVIWSMSPTSTLKLSQGRNLRYQNGFDQLNNSNTSLSPEKLDATELVFENKWSGQSRLLASVYQYRVNDIIQSPYQAGLADRIFGQELELEHVWENSTRLRGSIAHQDSNRDSSVSADYRPAYLSKLNLSWPLLQSRGRMAVDVRYNSHYLDNQQQVGGNVITNLTFNINEVLPHTNMRFNISNLFNANNATSDNSPIFDRSFWVQLEYSR